MLTVISSVNPTLFLILHCALFSQKDVDLSKDDLLGDILQDLHSEVGSFVFLLFYFSDQQFYKTSFNFCFVAETNSSDSSTSCHSKEKEVSWITHEPLLHKTSDTKGVPQSSACELNVNYVFTFSTTTLTKKRVAHVISVTSGDLHIYGVKIQGAQATAC